MPDCTRLISRDAAIAVMPAAFKVGDRGWRGYARQYVEGSDWYPEIRPGTVTGVDEDGTLRLSMEGVMPGRERKRTPGGWISWGIEPELFHRTPEEALAQAKRAVAQQAEDRASHTKAGGA